jgi:hypothetical protein
LIGIAKAIPAAVLEPGAHDSDDEPILVDDRPAAVAGIDVGVELKDPAFAGLVGPQRRDRSSGGRDFGHHRVERVAADVESAAEWKAKHLNRLAGCEDVGVAESEVWLIRAARVDDCQIELGIGRRDRRLRARDRTAPGRDALGRIADFNPRHLHIDHNPAKRAVLQGDLAVAHHVLVGEHVSVWRDDEAGTAPDLDAVAGDHVLRAHEVDLGAD